MSSNALTGHLIPLLSDAKDLDYAHVGLRTGKPGRPFGLSALNRAAVVMCLSAWEAYIEELVRESLQALRPAGPALGVWPIHNAWIRGQLGRFNTPSADNVRSILSDAIGLPDVRPSWYWSNCTAARAEQRLAYALRIRHEVAHGVNQRPAVDNQYSSQLPGFFRRLGDCTDAAVRNHLVVTHGVAHPWPP